MGFGIISTFKPKLRRVQFECVGESLASNYEKLDWIARRAKLTPISAFGDNREMPDDFTGDPEDLESVLGSWDEWFSASDGLRTAEGLIKGLSGKSASKIAAGELEILLEELEELARCLRIADVKGSRFRLELG